MFTTPLLGALRRAYPDSRIDYAVSSYALPAIEAHPLIDSRLDIPNLQSPFTSLFRIVQTLRKSEYDAVIVPDRSPLLCLAAFLSGIRYRIGLNSGGRGLLYTQAAPTSPSDVRHEADIYLDLARTLKLDTSQTEMEYTPPAAARKTALKLLDEARLTDRPYVLLHPGGGRNPGMTLDLKRWPPPQFAQLAMRLMRETGLAVALVGGLGDDPILDSVKGFINLPFTNFGPRAWGIIGALAERCALYIGNDTGATHMAIGAGACTAMVMGPTDPRRYGPFGKPGRVAAAWNPWNVPRAGVRAGVNNFSWDNGVNVDDVMSVVSKLLATEVST
jgi:ADP-heptose:LPS heptosyltransferase